MPLFIEEGHKVRKGKRKGCDRERRIRTHGDFETFTRRSDDILCGTDVTMLIYKSRSRALIVLKRKVMHIPPLGQPRPRT